MGNLIKLNIGKNGLTSEFIENLRKNFVNAESARIGLLKSSTRDRKEVKKWADEIVSKLGKNYTYKIIGYTIAVRKWRPSFVRKD
jgi:RNA-binding protein YhbY